MSDTTAIGEFVRAGDRCLSRRDVMQRAARVAGGIGTTSPREARAVALLMRNDIPFVETIFAAGFLGAQAVPINWHSTPDEIAYILEDCGATHLVAHADLLYDVIDRLPPGVVPLCVATPAHIVSAYEIDPVRAQPPAGVDEWEPWLETQTPLPRGSQGNGGTMMYTSGTTGKPKGVRRQAVDARRRAADAQLRQRWFGNRPGQRTAIVGPMYHSVQLSYTTAALSAPGSVVLEPRFDAERLLALIERDRLTHIHLVPIMMNRLAALPVDVRGRYDVSSLEFVIHGAAPCAPHVKRALIAWFGPIVHEYYGTTEAGMVSRASSEEWLQRPGTVGRPWAGREVRIYDAGGEVLGPGIEGEVYASLGGMPDFTYHNAPEARARIERDGRVTSGDIGYLDDEGYLYLCDRKVDIVISGGVNIYPVEIEAVLCTHPEVVDAAVFGVPDEEFGERLLSVVALRGGGQRVSADELRQFARARLSSFKVPRTIEIRDTLPRDESGKIFKRQLRDPYWAATGRRI